MYQKVLVAVDERAGGRDAIALARELLASDGTLTLAHVHAGYPLKGRGSSPDFEAAQRDHALEILEHIRAEVGIEAQTRCVGSTSVGRGLHHLAEVTDADLLVVGSTRRGLFGRVLIGDDTSAALDGAPCAVAIAPAGYAQHPKAMREIGVAYDGSPDAKQALEFARALAGQHGAKLSAMQVVELPSYAFMGGPIAVDAPFEEMLDDARTRLGALDGVEPHVVYGQAAEELALYSASVDVLAIASRGYGPVGRLMHGSTTRQLARTARSPLLVLTRPGAEPGPHTHDAAAAASENGHKSPIASGV